MEGIRKGLRNEIYIIAINNIYFVDRQQVSKLKNISTIGAFLSATLKRVAKGKPYTEEITPLFPLSYEMGNYTIKFYSDNIIFCCGCVIEQKINLKQLEEVIEQILSGIKINAITTEEIANIL